MTCISVITTATERVGEETLLHYITVGALGREEIEEYDGK